MIIAITGTPGTGKSTVREQLKNEGYRVLDLNEIALSKKLILEYDEERQSTEVNLPALNKYLDKLLGNQDNKYLKNELIFIEGHIAHLLDIVDLVIVLRCHPEVLQKRLTNKGWEPRKIRENLEAEAIDTITIESIEKHKQNNIFEIDTTYGKPDVISKKIIEIVTGKTKGYEPGKVDWSEEILKWY